MEQAVRERVAVAVPHVPREAVQPAGQRQLRELDLRPQVRTGGRERDRTDHDLRLASPLPQSHIDERVLPRKPGRSGLGGLTSPVSGVAASCSLRLGSVPVDLSQLRPGREQA